MMEFWTKRNASGWSGVPSGPTRDATLAYRGVLRTTYVASLAEACDPGNAVGCNAAVVEAEVLGPLLV